jgi:hypothetical protein
LLDIAIKHPAVAAVSMAPLVKAIPVLTALDTTHLAGEYLHVCFSALPFEDRQAIEQITAVRGKLREVGVSG